MILNSIRLFDFATTGMYFATRKQLRTKIWQREIRKSTVQTIWNT